MSFSVVSVVTGSQLVYTKGAPTIRARSRAHHGVSSMSMNRPKRVSHTSTKDVEVSLFGQPKEEKAVVIWAEATAGKSDSDFGAYSVKTTYAEGDLLNHPKFGNGIVVLVELAKIDVLFESGTRKLVHAM